VEHSAVPERLQLNLMNEAGLVWCFSGRSGLLFGKQPCFQATLMQAPVIYISFTIFYFVVGLYVEVD
jgi:hypothetical protein